MVLTDREIESSIESGHITVDPMHTAEAFSSTALDLTLDSLARLWKIPSAAGIRQEIDPSANGYSFQRLVEDLTEEVSLSNDYLLEPRAFLLAFTSEEISLPSHSRIAARVEGKSSLARLGLAIHVTAPTIHAGFRGQIQLEICNLGPLSVRLRPGMRVCQLIFEQTLGTPNKGYQGQFFGQSA